MVIQGRFYISDGDPGQGLVMENPEQVFLLVMVIQTRVYISNGDPWQELY